VKKTFCLAGERSERPEARQVFCSKKVRAKVSISPPIGKRNPFITTRQPGFEQCFSETGHSLLAISLIATLSSIIGRLNFIPLFVRRE
jgi:hypothetical protein